MPKPCSERDRLREAHYQANAGSVRLEWHSTVCTVRVGDQRGTRQSRSRPPGRRAKDYTLEIQGRPIPITKEQFDDGMWQEIVRLGSIAVSHRRGKFKSDSAQEQCARSCGR